VCFNFVEGGRCYATGTECLLGTRGVSANNRDAVCALHGRFDVWLTEKDQLLVTDLGFPAEEPKQCLALSVNEALARKIACDKASELGSSILTTERTCLKCGSQYWISGHKLPATGKSRLCPNCIANVTALQEKPNVLDSWCG
jgi:hypothetical protein